ncbi:hypothetical protein AB4406_22340 [Vibrio splendidus]
MSRWLDGELKTNVEINRALELIDEWFERLTYISWFMRNLNERVPRAANKEEGCIGRFWEGRFKSQCYWMKNTLDCMAYVDLNSEWIGISQSLG